MRWKNDDICDNIDQGDDSFYNSPDAEKQDKFQASIDREVEEEPGGIIPQEVTVVDSDSPTPESLFKTDAEYFVTIGTPIYNGHTDGHTSPSSVRKPKQPFWLAINCNHVAWQPYWIIWWTFVLFQT